MSTRPLDTLRAADAALYGGKSASLGELIASGIPVPPGFAVSAAAYRALELDFALADPEDLDALRAASREAMETIRGAPLPDGLRAELDRRYADLGDEPPVAVRSSALGEDSAEATFAGQQETFLWVRGAEPVADAVRECWASLFTPEAMSYRARIGGAGEPAAMGVTVQRMVDAEVSGVLFTCNPVSGDPSTVAVNASWGLGLAVVGGEVTPDEYRVSKVSREVLHRAVASKPVEYVAGLAGAGTLRVDVPEPRREAACLTDDQLQALVDLARRIERHFGCHQDVEWAIARDGGDVFVLQSRPVTAAPKPAPAPPRASAIDLVMGTFGAKRQ
jgi:pyruvate, water dikinase